MLDSSDKSNNNISSMAYYNSYSVSRRDKKKNFRENVQTRPLSTLEKKPALAPKSNSYTAAQTTRVMPAYSHSHIQNIPFSNLPKQSEYNSVTSAAIKPSVSEDYAELSYNRPSLTAKPILPKRHSHSKPQSALLEQRNKLLKVKPSRSSQANKSPRGVKGEGCLILPYL